MQLVHLEDYARFPCSRVKTNKTGYKAPLIVDWQNSATTDPTQIAEWKAQFPHPMWGFLCGLKFDVLDIDPDGRDWLQQHESQLPPTRLQYTPRGRHYFFQALPGLKSSRGKIAKGVEVRSFGLYVIGWEWEGLPVINLPLAPWPEWLLLSLAKKEMGVTSEIYVTPISVSLDPPTEYQINYSSRALANACHELRQCSVGRRNDLLNILAYKVGRLIVRGWIPRERVEVYLLRACAANGLLADDGVRQCRATIGSGIYAGIQRPYHDIAPS